MRRILTGMMLAGGLAFSAWAQVSLTDDLGRQVTLPHPPERIVSLAPSLTETLFAIGAGPQVAGVTDYCTYPPEAQKKPRVGGLTTPSIEAIVALHPDLVVVSMEGNLREDFTRLAGLGIPVFVSNPRTLHDIYRSITDLGTLTGRVDEAAAVVRGMQDRERRIALPMRVRAEPSVLLVVALQPLIVAGKGTFLSELVTLAGGRNLAAASITSYPQYSRETVVKENPDVLVILSDAGGKGAGITDLFPEWDRLNAVTHHRVYRVDSDLFSRPGPRAAEALYQLARLLHSTP